MTSPVLAPRLEVAPPVFERRPYGLLSAIAPRTVTDPHWRNGVWWPSRCGTGNRTPFTCVTDAGQVTGLTGNITKYDFSAHPAVVYAEIECSLPGYDAQQARADVLDSLARVEEYQLEAGFWTGEAPVSGPTGRIYPNLISTARVLDPMFGTTSGEVVMQMAVTSVAPTGQTLDIAEGLARLEDALGDCADGAGVIHMTIAVADLAQANNLLIERNGRKYTALGNVVVIGAGYPGTGPGGITVSGVHWMYATGPMFTIRGDEEVLGVDVREYFDRATNTIKVIAERVFIVAYECCLLTVPISLGGVVGGAPDART